MSEPVNCTHQSKLHITLSPWSMTRELRCVKCGAKKIKEETIVPQTWIDYREPRKGLYKPPNAAKKRFWQRS